MYYSFALVLLDVHIKQRRHQIIWLKMFGMNSSIIPLFCTFRTSIKNSTWFICRSNLNLHKKCFIVGTLWTFCGSSINIFPCISTSQHIIHLFFLDFGIARIFLQNFMIEGTCWTTKSHSTNKTIFFNE